MAVSAGAGLREAAVAAGPDFLRRCAAQLLACSDGRPAEWEVVVPNLLLAPAFKRALAAEAGRSLWLPSVETLPARLEPLLGTIDFLPDSRRRFALYAALRARRWLDEGSLWAVAGELIELFDALTLEGAGLPESEDALVARLAEVYGLRDSAPLRFEARLVHELWKAEAAGRPSRAAARLLAAAAWSRQAARPLFVVAEGALTSFEARTYAAYGEHRPVVVCRPDRSGGEGVLALLEAAWPSAADAAVPAERARSVTAGASLAGRVALVAAESLEEEAEAVAAQVRAWLAQGCRDIALVAMDRVAARRARALLERDGVLIADETGWKLITTRAAAVVDAWLEVMASDGYHRAVVDLCRSPFAFADMPEDARHEALAALERLLAEYNISAGLDRIAELAARTPATAAARLLLERLLAARAAMPRGRATPAEWLDAVDAALDRLGVTAAHEADAAGQQWREWWRRHRTELGGEDCRLNFAEWRGWLDGELERALFRDRGIVSPVVMTHLPGTRLRRFDAAIVIGADARHLAPEDPRPVFAHEGVRRELGLPAAEEARARLREDLALLVAFCGQVSFSWQRLAGDEELLPAAEIEVLDLVQRLVAGSGLQVRIARDPLPPRPQAGSPRPAPRVAAAALPTAVSASAYASAVACPYQFFARYVLRLAETEAVQEALDKRDYGELVHLVLQRFHARFPIVSEVDEATLLAALEAETDAVFGEAVGRNYLTHAWRLRWRARLPDYLRWQREREVAGWRHQRAEQRFSRPLRRRDGAELMLYGRVDRIDVHADGRLAVLDYKTRDRRSLLRQAGDPEDVQLAIYTALVGEAVGEAAYVALDDSPIGAAPVDDPQATAAAHQARLVEIFSAAAEGAPLPAHGGETVCAWCEVQGLCRKDYQA